jgi:hypothetical protein
VSRRGVAVLALLLALILTLGGILWFLQARQPDPGPTTFSSWYPMTNEDGDPAFADFENHVPCTDDFERLDGCDRMKFGIVFYRDAETGAPTSYVMSRIYVGLGDERTVDTGTWSIVHGTALDVEAIVYRLDSGAPPEFGAFWAIGEDILFVLDRELNPRVGDAGYSYALNSVPLGQTYTVPPDD